MTFNKASFFLYFNVKTSLLNPINFLKYNKWHYLLYYRSFLKQNCKLEI